MFTSKMFKSPISANSKDAGAFMESLFGSRFQSSAGIKVTEQKALAVPTFFSCVTNLASDIAQLPCNLYKIDQDDKKGRHKASDHQAHRLVNGRPNGWQTPYEYFEFQGLSIACRGRSYAFIERDAKSRPEELIPLDATKMVVYKGDDRLPYYSPSGNGDDIVPMRHINHVRWYSLDGYTGISPIQYHTETLGLSIATRKHASSVFANGTNLAGVLERPALVGQTKLDALGRERIDEILTQWEARYSGSDNAKRVAFLQEGITFRPLSMTNEDAQLIDSRKLSALEIAQIYRMPPHKVGILDNATFSNIEHQNIEYVVNTLMPWLKRFEQALSRDLLLRDERGPHYFEFNVSGLLRGDTKSRYESYALARQWGWLSINDIRRMENLPPVEGGDTYLEPMNMQAAGSFNQSLDQIKAIVALQP